MDKEYDERTGTHGIEYLAFAKVTKTTDGALDTSVEPKVLTGARKANIETSQESEDQYADNQVHMTLWGAETSEGEMITYQLPQQFVLDHLGKQLTPNGAIADGGARSNFVLQFIRTITDEFGGEKKELQVWYNVQAGQPTGEDVTDEDKVTLKEITTPLKAYKNPLVKVDGKAIAGMSLLIDNTNAELLDLAYRQIIMPDTSVPVEDPETTEEVPEA